MLKALQAAQGLIIDPVSVALTCDMLDSLHCPFLYCWTSWSAAWKNKEVEAALWKAEKKYFFFLWDNQNQFLFSLAFHKLQNGALILPLAQSSRGAGERGWHDAHGDALTTRIFSVIFLQTPINTTPRCHRWWEAPTPPVIHPCKSWGVSGSRGVWIEAVDFNSGCVGDSACPGAGR